MVPCVNRKKRRAESINTQNLRYVSTTLLSFRLICAFVSGVKVVIAYKGGLGVKVKFLVDSFQCNTIDNNRQSARTNFGNVPADLCSAGIEYKNLRSA